MSHVSREEADKLILERYEAIVLTIRKRLRVDEMEALDLAHDVVAAIYDSLDKFDPQKGPFEAWVAGITRNHILRRLEGRGRIVPGKKEAEKNLSLLDDMVLDEVSDYLRLALNNQPQIYRDTLRMRFLEGKDLKEIAKEQKVPLGTVKARLSRAPDLLKDKLHIQRTTVRFYLENRPRQ